MRRKKTIFRARPGAMFDDDQAQVIGEYLSKLQGGTADTFTPGEVLEAARPKSSPIHEFFNWDDSTAAEAWRLQQARLIVNHIEVIVRTDGGERNVRAFLNVELPQGDDGGPTRVYMAAEAVASSEYFRSQVIAEALAEVRRWQSRYKEYRELAAIFGAIERTELELRQ